MIDPSEALDQLIKTASDASKWNKSQRLAALPGMWMLIEELEKHIRENDVDDSLYAGEKLGAVKTHLRRAFDGHEDDAEVVKDQLFRLWSAVGNLREGIFG